MPRFAVYAIVGALAIVLIHYLQPILFPFLVALALAYLGDPLADRLEKSRYINRTGAVIIVFSLLSLLVVALLLVLIPALWKQGDHLLQQLPKALDALFNQFLPYVMDKVGLERDAFSYQHLKEMMLEQVGAAGGVVKTLLGSMTTSGLTAMTWLANLFLIPVVTFYLLRDWDVLIANIGQQIPRPWFTQVQAMAKDCDLVLSEFIRGQLVVMFLLGCVYSLGLWFVGLELALFVGMLAGLASIVPYMGVIVGVSAGLIAGWLQFHHITPLAYIGGVFVVGQLLEGMVFTPIFVGKRIGLHPVAVIFSIMVGGQLAGFVGILLALPAAAVVMVLLRYAHGYYINSQFYTEAPELAIAEGMSFGDNLADSESATDNHTHSTATHSTANASDTADSNDKSAAPTAKEPSA